MIRIRSFSYNMNIDSIIGESDSPDVTRDLWPVGMVDHGQHRAVGRDVGPRAPANTSAGTLLAWARTRRACLPSAVGAEIIARPKRSIAPSIDCSPIKADERNDEGAQLPYRSVMKKHDSA